MACGSSRPSSVSPRVPWSSTEGRRRRQLEARASARLSLYRVDRIEVGEGIEVSDLLSGASCFLNDSSLSTTAEVGYVVPARVYPAGSFRFAVLVGPALGGAEAAAALDFLSSELALRSTPRTS